jgi:hypothetical protein
MTLPTSSSSRLLIWPKVRPFMSGCHLSTLHSMCSAADLCSHQPSSIQTSNIGTVDGSSGSCYMFSHSAYRYQSASTSHSNSLQPTYTRGSSTLRCLLALPRMNCTCRLLEILTSSIATTLHGNDSIALQSPRCSLPSCSPDQGLVARRRGRDVQIQACFLRLDGTTDGKLVSCSFGPEHGD